MHQKTLVKQAWLDAGLYRSTDPKLAAFLKHVEEAVTDCWLELLQEVREHYPECKEQIVTPIWDTGNKFLRLHIIRAADPESEEDVAIFRRLVQGPNTHGDDVELHALLRVAQRRGLSVG